MRAQIVIGWILSLVAAVLFAFAGVLKLIQSGTEVDTFAAFGLPLWVMDVVGVIEIGGAVLLVFTKRRQLGAVLLTLVGLAAAAESVAHGLAAAALLPLVSAACALGGAFLRDAADRSRTLG